MAAGAFYVVTQGAPWGLVGGLALGVFLTPDIDIDHRTREEAELWKFSPVLGWVWQSFWTPYALAIKHRSWLSHAPIIGTLGRGAWLLVGVYLIWNTVSPVWAWASTVDGIAFLAGWMLDIPCIFSSTRFSMATGAGGGEGAGDELIDKLLHT